MGSSSPSRVLYFFTLFSRSLPLGWDNSIVRWLHGKALFGSFSAIIFGRKERKKSEKIQKKKTGAPADCCHWKNLKIPHKYEGLSRRTTERKRENRTDEKSGKRTWKLDWKQNWLSLFQIYIEKRKRRRKEKRYAGEGKEEERKMRSGLAIDRRSYRQGSGAERG